YWDKDYEAKVKADGYEYLLVCTRLYLARHAPDLVDNKALPKIKNQHRQQKPWYRTSNIDEDIMDKIDALHEWYALPDKKLSCRKIAVLLRKVYGIQVDYSTVYRIMNGKYKLELKKK
ncbi:MAG: helix-turn-helix domain-containing protein, partial [Caulobacteraceae bacterium]